METAAVRQRVVETIQRAKRGAHDRRVRTDSARLEFTHLLDTVLVPIVRQVAQALKADGYPFGVDTPAGAVRLTSERSSVDYIELTLDTDSDEPWVVGRTRRTWGRRVLESDRPVRRCPVREITEEDALTFLLKELEPFVER